MSVYDGISIGDVMSLDQLKIANRHIYENSVITIEDGTIDFLSNHIGGGGTTPSTNEFSRIYFLKQGSTAVNDNGNYRMVIDTSSTSLHVDKREGGAWVNKTEIGSLKSLLFTLDGLSGIFAYDDGNGNLKIIAKPSVTGEGTVFGDIQGHINLISNGQMYSYEFNQTEQTQVLNANSDVTQTNNTFAIPFTSTRVEAILSATIELSAVPANTTCRAFYTNSNGVEIAYNNTESEFVDGVAQSVTNGVNTLNIKLPHAIPNNFIFNLNLQFKDESNNNVNVGLLGSNIDLNDGRGSRFIPKSTITYLAGARNNITTNSNVVTQLESLTGDNRLNATAIRNLPEAESFNPADHNVTEFSDVTSAGSGAIITTAERNKLSNIADNAEVNVQADWNETDNTSDAFINNKPNIPEQLTATEIKTLYESNADTNAFTDAQNTKLTNLNPLKNAVTNEHEIIFTREDNTTFNVLTSSFQHQQLNVGQGHTAGVLNVSNVDANFVHFHDDASNATAINITDTDLRHGSQFLFDYADVTTGSQLLTLSDSNTEFHNSNLRIYAGHIMFLYCFLPDPEQPKSSTNKLNIRQFQVMSDNQPPLTASLHNFSIDIPNKVVSGVSYAGDREISFGVTNRLYLNTNLQLRLGPVTKTLSFPARDGNITQTVNLTSTEWTNISNALPVNAFVTDGSVSSNTYNIATAQAQDLVYWDSQTSSSASDFNTATAESEPYRDSHSVTIETYTGNRYFAIAQRNSDADITSLQISGFEQIGAFNKNANAVTIGGVSYDVWLSNNALDGSVVSNSVVQIGRS